MISGLLRWFRNRGVDTPKEGSARPLEAYDIATLFPVVLPLGNLSDGFPGPIVRLGRLPFAVGWVTASRPNFFADVSEELAGHWEARGIDWRAEAMLNLARNSKGLWWGDKCDDAGRPFLLSLLTQDALGPSRLLLPHLFDDVLGTPYRVAIPERTCAIAYRTDLDAAQQADVDGVIDGCFAHGTQPMSNQRFDPAEFWIPLDQTPTGRGLRGAPSPG